MTNPPAGERGALEVVSRDARALANHVAWLVAATAAAVLALLFLYRLAVRRLARAPTSV
jgi:hypothetical protein